MLTPAFNDHRELTAEYDTLARLTAERYGPRSQALVFVLTEELIRLRTVLARDPGAMVIAARVDRLREAIQDLYRVSEFPALTSPSSRVVSESPLVIEFDRDRFEERYAAAVPVVSPRLVEVSGPLLGPLRAGVPYMFVIDDRGTLVVWNRAFRLRDLVFGRATAMAAGVRVAHPLLVPQRLMAQAAGEIVFVGEPRVCAVVANTKSGHFRPPPATRDTIRRVCSTVLELDRRDVDVFTLELPDTGDGHDRRS